MAIRRPPRITEGIETTDTFSPPFESAVLVLVVTAPTLAILGDTLPEPFQIALLGALVVALAIVCLAAGRDTLEWVSRVNR